MEEQLAASGFVVAAPDFPFTSANSEWLDRGDVVNQAADVSALITQLTDPTTVPDALRGVIAPGPVGVVGHSDGGITAAAVAYNSSVADPACGRGGHPVGRRDHVRRAVVHDRVAAVARDPR